MLRRSKRPKGLCVNCAVHDWLRNTYPVNILLSKSGPRTLLYPHMQEQFIEIMKVAGADASPDEINWILINENWELPFPKRLRSSPMNPCSQKEIDEIREGKSKAFDCPPKLLQLHEKMVITSFDEANQVKPGLGDELKKLLNKHAKKGVTMGKKSAMQKEVERTEGEQMALMDVAPKNAKAIIEATKSYLLAQKDRLKALALEVELKEKVRILVKQAKMQPIEGGMIKFKYDGYLFSVTPRDELFRIKEIKTVKKGKQKKKSCRTYART